MGAMVSREKNRVAGKFGGRKTWDRKMGKWKFLAACERVGLWQRRAADPKPGRTNTDRTAETRRTRSGKPQPNDFNHGWINTDFTEVNKGNEAADRWRRESRVGLPRKNAKDAKGDRIMAGQNQMLSHFGFHGFEWLVWFVLYLEFCALAGGRVGTRFVDNSAT